MELENIIKLIDAGYTKDDINSLLNPSESAEADQDQTPASTQAEPEQPAQSPAGNQDQILEAINKLTSAIMSKNLNTTTAETLKEQTAQDILAKVIAPPKPNKKG